MLVLGLIAATASTAPGEKAERGDKGGRGGSAGKGEIQISDEDFKRLEVFEAHALTKADKVFISGDYRRSTAEYDSFILEFAKSRALPYALLRKARSLDLDEKRNQAIQAYQEVVDYFPNAVRYAAAALYYIGKCQWDNGDTEKAVKTWTTMANDEGYRKHELAGPAINYLADVMSKQGKTEQAAGYYRQVAIDFRKDNGDAANYAIGKAVEYYVRLASSEQALRQFYQEVGGFEERRIRVEEDLANSRAYWKTVVSLVERHGSFGQNETDLREHYYRYWAGALAGKFPDWDDYQIALAAFQLAVDKDPAKWAARLDEQFSKYQKDGDYGRIIRWIDVYHKQKNKVEEYYAKLDFAKMNIEQIQELMRVLYDQVADAAMAKNVFAKIPLGKLKDPQKVMLARYLWKRDGELVERVCAAIDDKDFGQMEFLRYYRFAENAKAGLPVAEGMLGHPKYAAEALWTKAELLECSRQYAKAVAAYQQCDNPPANLWRIADCYVKLSKIDQAVGQLREIENFFKDDASAAALKIAHVYRGGGREKEYVAGLRYVLAKYPKSQQSSAAHQELEKLGKKIGGGVDAD